MYYLIENNGKNAIPQYRVREVCETLKEAQTKLKEIKRIAKIRDYYCEVLLLTE